MHGTHSILIGDVLDRLAELPADHFHCVVTSPPYWGLRDYGTEGQIGLEPTPEEFVAKMVAVFRAVRRVLRPDGVCWVNLGDSYTSGGRDSFGTFSPESKQATHAEIKRTPRAAQPSGLKPKDLIGMPWRAAFALQADGWWLRSDCIWHKPNPMPESVTDRPTKAHEYVFLLTKAARYFWDQEAVRVASRPSGWQREREQGRARPMGYDSSRNDCERLGPIGDGTANLRTVWTIPTQAYSEAHFATYPEKLAETCIRAGTSEKGCCATCGAPVRRVVDKQRTFESGSGRAGNLPAGKNGTLLQGGGETVDVRRGPVVQVTTTGWQPTCTCDNDTTTRCRVLDPFAGSGTTLLVACRLGCNATGIELNPDYAKLAEKRIEKGLKPNTFRDNDKIIDAPLFQ